jgi:hypothetical protein
MKILFRYPKGFQGWEKVLEMSHVPREGETKAARPGSVEQTIFFADYAKAIAAH